MDDVDNLTVMIGESMGRGHGSLGRDDDCVEIVNDVGHKMSAAVSKGDYVGWKRPSVVIQRLCLLV